jgi:hypothetical protein
MSNFTASPKVMHYQEYIPCNISFKNMALTMVLQLNVDNKTKAMKANID